MMNIAKIREALNDATWGTWTVQALNGGETLHGALLAKCGDGMDGKTYFVCVDDAYVHDAKDDAYLIANAHQWLEELCDEVERLERLTKAEYTWTLNTKDLPDGNYLTCALCKEAKEGIAYCENPECPGMGK